MTVHNFSYNIIITHKHQTPVANIAVIALDVSTKSFYVRPSWRIVVRWLTIVRQANYLGM